MLVLLSQRAEQEVHGQALAPGLDWRSETATARLSPPAPGWAGSHRRDWAGAPRGPGPPSPARSYIAPGARPVRSCASDPSAGSRPRLTRCRVAVPPGIAAAAPDRRPTLRHRPRRWRQVARRDPPEPPKPRTLGTPGRAGRRSPARLGRPALQNAAGSFHGFGAGWHRTTSRSPPRPGGPPPTCWVRVCHPVSLVWPKGNRKAGQAGSGQTHVAWQRGGTGRTPLWAADPCVRSGAWNEACRAWPEPHTRVGRSEDSASGPCHPATCVCPDISPSFLDKPSLRAIPLVTAQRRSQISRIQNRSGRAGWLDGRQCDGCAAPRHGGSGKNG